MTSFPKVGVVKLSSILAEDNFSARYWLGDVAAIEQRIAEREQKLTECREAVRKLYQARPRHPGQRAGGNLERRATIRSIAANREKVYAGIRHLRSLRLDQQRDNRRLQEERRRVTKLKRRYNYNTTG